MTKIRCLTYGNGTLLELRAGSVHSLARTAKIKVVELRETLSEYSLKDLPKDKDIQQQIAKDNAQKLEKLLLTLEEQTHR